MNAAGKEEPMEDNNALLVWDTGEGIEFFVIPHNVYEEYQVYLDEAHGKMLNSDDTNDGLEFLNVAVYPKAKVEKWMVEYPHPEHVGVLYRYKTYDRSPIKANISVVILSGFMP